MWFSVLDNALSPLCPVSAERIQNEAVRASSAQSHRDGHCYRRPTREIGPVLEDQAWKRGKSTPNGTRHLVSSALTPTREIMSHM